MRCSPSNILALSLLGMVLTHFEASALDIRKVFNKDQSKEMSGSESKGSESAQLDSKKQMKASQARKITTSCDRDMAKSLVVLSEQKEAAEDAHDDCLEMLDTANNETEFWKKQFAVGEENCKSEIEEMEGQLKASRVSAEMRVDAVKERLRESTEQVELQASEMVRLAEVHAEELENVTKTAEVRRDELAEELEEKCKKRIADVELAKDILHNATKDVVTDLKQKLEEQKLEEEAQRVAMDEEKQKLVDEHKAKIVEIQSDHKEKAEKMSKAAEEKLQTTKESMELVIEERDDTILSFEAKVAELEDEISKLNKSRKHFEKSYKKAKQDLEAWESLHSQRSYCNITHVAEDAVITANSAAKALLVLADEMVQIVLQEFQLYVVKPTEEWSRPHVIKVQKWYAKNIEPDYNRYLKSHVANVKRTMTRLIETATRYVTDAFVKSCPQALKLLRSQEVTPSQVILSVESACQNPNDTIRGLLNSLAVILLFTFRSTIVSLLFLPFRIFTLPMRLLNGNKSNLKKSPESSRKISQ